MIQEATFTLQEQGKLSTYKPRHTIVANNGDIYLFAGADSDSRTNDLFLFSIGISRLFTKRYKEMV